MARNAPSGDEVNSRRFNAFLDSLRGIGQVISPETDMFECRVGLVWQENQDSSDTPLLHPFEQEGGYMLLCAFTAELEKATLAKLKSFGHENIYISNGTLSDVLTAVESRKEQDLHSRLHLTIFYNDDLILIGPDQLELLIQQNEGVQQRRALYKLVTTLKSHHVDDEIVRDAVQAAEFSTVFVIEGVNPDAIEDPARKAAVGFPPALIADRPHESTSDIFNSGGVVFATEELAYAYLNACGATDLYRIRSEELGKLLTAFTYTHDGDISRQKGLEIHLPNRVERLTMAEAFALTDHVGFVNKAPTPPSLSD